jgi:hypothetical protein
MGGVLKPADQRDRSKFTAFPTVRSGTSPISLLRS